MFPRGSVDLGSMVAGNIGDRPLLNWDERSIRVDSYGYPILTLLQRPFYRGEIPQASLSAEIGQDVARDVDAIRVAAAEMIFLGMPR